MIRCLLLICLFMPIWATALPIQGNVVVDQDLTIEPGHYQLESFVINQGATLSFLPDFDVETVVFEVQDYINIFGTIVLGNYDLELIGWGEIWLAEGGAIQAQSSTITLTSSFLNGGGGSLSVFNDPDISLSTFLSFPTIDLVVPSYVERCNCSIAVDLDGPLELQTVPASSSILLTLLGLFVLLITRHWQPILKK